MFRNQILHSAKNRHLKIGFMNLVRNQLLSPSFVERTPPLSEDSVLPVIEERVVVFGIGFAITKIVKILLILTRKIVAILGVDEIARPLLKSL